MVKSVQINSLALLNVSDHISRKRFGKCGILLGHTDEKQTVVTVATSFELKTEGDAAAPKVDWTHLHKRLTLMKTVLPQYQLVGFYQISDTSEPNELTRALVDQFTPGVCVVFGSGEDEDVKSYHIETLRPITTNIQTTSIENIATSTIINDQYLSTATPTPRDSEKDDGLKVSLEQLESKTAKLLQYTQSDPIPPKSAEIFRLITHLSNKLESFKAHELESLSTSNHVEATQLSLLTSQLAALDDLKYNISKNLRAYGMNSRAQSQIGQFH